MQYLLDGLEEMEKALLKESVMKIKEFCKKHYYSIRGCVFARNIDHLIKDDRSRKAIEAAETYCCGESTDSDLNVSMDEAIKAATSCAEMILVYETQGILYRNRFNREMPGRFDLQHNSNDSENTLRYAEWVKSGLYSIDALLALNAAYDKIALLENEIGKIKEDTK